MASTQPESTLVLGGAMKYEGKFVAYVEDTSTGKTVEVTAGGSIARGTVTSVDLEGIVYTVDGKPRRILMGQSLSEGGGAANAPRPAGETGEPSRLTK
jgi:hypothetical protein